MAINPSNQFPGKIAAASVDYPYGEARDVTAPGDGTGTPFVAALVNDIFGFQQALMDESGRVPSGSPETAVASQYLSALRDIFGANVTTVQAADSPYVATRAQAGLVLVDASAGDVSFTLPAASVLKGLRYTIVRVDSSGNTVTAYADTDAPDTIDGDASRTVGVGERLPLVGDGVDQWLTQVTTIKTFLKSHYNATGLHSGGASTDATARRTVSTPEGVEVEIGGQSLVLAAAQSLDLNVANNWDDGTFATAANRAGKDAYLYYCQPLAGTAPDLILSTNSTVPSAMPSGETPTADNTRKIAGFHTLCADVGTIAGHTLSDYITGDVLPRSVWDLMHRPDSAPEGMVYSDAGKWIDIYPPSVSGGEAVSAYGATVATGTTTEAFHAYKWDQWFARIKKKPIASLEFVDASIGSNQGTNIAGSADPGTAGGHSDTAGRRMISNIGCEDMAGAWWQRGREQGATNDAGSAYVDAYDANDSDVGGQHYEAPNRPIFGGHWSNGVLCGSRASNWAASPLYLGAADSSRGVAEPRVTRF